MRNLAPNTRWYDTPHNTKNTASPLLPCRTVPHSHSSKIQHPLPLIYLLNKRLPPRLSQRINHINIRLIQTRRLCNSIPRVQPLPHKLHSPPHRRNILPTSQPHAFKQRQQDSTNPSCPINQIQKPPAYNIPMPRFNRHDRAHEDTELLVLTSKQRAGRRQEIDDAE